MRFTIIGFALALLIILDATITYIGVGRGIPEANPLSRFLVESGVYSIVKTAVAIIIYVLLVKVDNRVRHIRPNPNQQFLIRLVFAASLFVAIIHLHAIIHNMWVLGWLAGL